MPNSEVPGKDKVSLVKEDLHYATSNYYCKIK